VAPGDDAAALGVAAVGDAGDRPVGGDGAVAELQATLVAIDPAADGVRGDAGGQVIADLGALERQSAPAVDAASAREGEGARTPGHGGPTGTVALGPTRLPLMTLSVTLTVAPSAK
jgi:hypothetical protein